MFHYSKAEKLIIDTYVKARETLGVRASITKSSTVLNIDKDEVCKVLGFDPIRYS